MKWSLIVSRSKTKAANALLAVDVGIKVYCSRLKGSEAMLGVPSTLPHLSSTLLMPMRYHRISNVECFYETLPSTVVQRQYGLVLTGLVGALLIKR